MNISSEINMPDLRKNISRFVKIIFICFIFFVLSFGREFSILSFGRVYITEIMLFLGLSVLIFDVKNAIDLPHSFRMVVLIYFMIGCFYLAIGFLSGNRFALRDVVLCGYVLFLPISLVTLSSKKMLKIFLLTIAVSNIIGLAIVRLCIYNNFPWWPLHEFFGRIKAFNYIFYYGMSLSFTVSFFGLLKKAMHKVLIVMLCAFNLYLLFIWGVRASWIACIALGIFMFLILKKKWLMEFVAYFTPVFLIISLLFLISRDYEHVNKEILSGKLASMNSFIMNRVVSAKSHFSRNTAPAVNTPQNNVLQVESGISVDKPDENSVKLSLEQSAQNAREQQPEKPLEQSVQNALEQQPEKEVGPDSIYYEVYQQKEMHPSNEKYVSNFASMIWRLDVWDLAIKFGLKNPIFGRGFGVYPVFAKSNRIGVDSRVTPMHNHLISIFYKMGFVGLILFVFINIYVFLYGLRYLKKAKEEFTVCFLAGALGSFIFWHMMALFFDMIDSPPTSIFLWIIIGLIFACVKVDEKN